jgi:hypothetical protein
MPQRHNTMVHDAADVAVADHRHGLVWLWVIDAGACKFGDWAVDWRLAGDSDSGGWSCNPQMG